ncbi:hypothetical protein [Prosthecobacter sp.]|uniref:hypothetical protein n=1 Tax=Prosthecobacter sp. TaxID=1965333 RepID=UPI003783ED53
MDKDLTLFDDEKPRYLLPEGCKDLYDVIRQQERAAADRAARRKAGLMHAELITNWLQKHAPAPPFESLPPMPDSVLLPDSLTVGDLAALLHLKNYKLISILIQMQTFASASSEIGFPLACAVCRHLGVEVKRMGEV